jgi:hypothetical protein
VSPSDYEVRFGFCGNLYFHTIIARKAGVVYPTHRHGYAHASRVVGRVKYLGEDGTEQIVEGTAEAPGLIEIPAGKAHGFVLLDEGSVVECIHVLREEDGMPLGFDCSLKDASAATGRC